MDTVSVVNGMKRGRGANVRSRRIRFLEGGMVWWGTLMMVVSAAVAACAAHGIELTHDDLTAFSAAGTVRPVGYEPPPFRVDTAGNTRVGSLTGVSGGSLSSPGTGAGDPRFEVEYALSDPASGVRDRVLEALRFELGTDVESQDVLRPETDDVEVVQRAAGPQGWAFEVKTLRWGLMPHESLWTRQQVVYSARARLIDLESARVVWRAECDASEGRPPTHSTIPELTAHDAERLKSRLAEAAERCADALTQRFFAGIR